MRTLGTVNASLAGQGFEQDWHLIAATTSKDFVDAALAQQKPRHNSDIMNSPTNTRAQKAVSKLFFSTAMVTLSDGYKMRLKHTGDAMNQAFGPLTAFSTHNYADTYSPEIVALHGGGAPQPVAQEPVMPTLQQMHRMTAESPRSTAKQFLLMEELSYRHLYGVGQIRLGNFVVQSPVSTYAFEDDFASSGARGLVDWLTAALKVIEAQMRGYAHGHGKSHSVPNGHDEPKQIVQTVAAQIANLGNNADVAAVEKIVQAATEEYNKKLIASASTRMYESDVLPARQLGQKVPLSRFSEKQQRQSRFDGEPDVDGRSTRTLIKVTLANSWLTLLEKTAQLCTVIACRVIPTRRFL